MAAPTTGNDYQSCYRTPQAGGGLFCGVHGAQFAFMAVQCKTVDVLIDVKAERARQFAKYGTNSDLEDGTGPGMPWLPGYLNTPQDSAVEIQEAFRRDYEHYEEAYGDPTWMHLVREEIAEAFAENDPIRLREELIQAAALCVSWIEKIDAREAKQ